MYYLEYKKINVNLICYIYIILNVSIQIVLLLKGLIIGYDICYMYDPVRDKFVELPPSDPNPPGPSTPPPMPPNDPSPLSNMDNNQNLTDNQAESSRQDESQQDRSASDVPFVELPGKIPEKLYFMDRF